MGPLGIHHDTAVTHTLIREAAPTVSLFLTSPYFNLTEDAANALLYSQAKDLSLIVAAPTANGFYKSQGFSYWVPILYRKGSPELPLLPLILLALQDFYTKVHSLPSATKTRLFEYNRPDWTYHAKGLWLFPSSLEGEALTVIGSSNLGLLPLSRPTVSASPHTGHRSQHRDIESQLILYTRQPALVQRLRQEQEALFAPSLRVTEATFKDQDNGLPLYLRLLYPYVKNLM